MGKTTPNQTKPNQTKPNQTMVDWLQSMMLKLLLPSYTAYSALDLTNKASAMVEDLLQLYSSYIGLQ